MLAGSPEAACRECTVPFQPNGSPSCAFGASTRPGRVLDPFLGSGTTAIAAEAHNRDWLGIELNPDYASVATDRIRTARQQRAPPHE